MGLDQFFYAKRYSSKSRWDNNSNRFFKEYPEELGEFYNYIMERNFASTEEQYQIGYFRKFNALHAFIVNNYASGVDECQLIYLGREQVKELLSKLRAVQEDHSKAQELLPTQDGFFFGDTHYNEWYYANVEQAIDMFERIDNFLEAHTHQLINYEGEPVFNDDGTPMIVCDWDIAYQASW